MCPMRKKDDYAIDTASVDHRVKWHIPWRMATHP